MTQKTAARMRQIWINDNLPVLRSMNSESVDLIYLDPPFNSGKQWESPIGGKKGRAKAAFKDTWHPSDTHIDEEYELSYECPQVLPLIRSLREINGDSWWAYLIYMAARLVEMRRILKPTGSIYYHCDPTMSHGVKLAMDAVFGRGNFRNELIWHYENKLRDSRKRGWQSATDTLFFYAKERGLHTFHPQHIALDKPKRFVKIRKIDGKKAAERDKDGNVLYVESAHKLMDNVLRVPMLTGGKERTGYPTQKPVALLERLIAASSDEGDVVLDPFCGCGTTLVAAQKLNRQWIGIDISDEAVRILRGRMPLFDESQDGSGVEEFVRRLPARADIPKMTKAEKERLRLELYRQQEGRCAAPCEDGKIGIKIELRQMHLDHKIARARGGQDARHNFHLLCPNCNQRKGADGMTRFASRIIREATARNAAAHRRKMEEAERNRREAADADDS